MSAPSKEQSVKKSAPEATVGADGSAKMPLTANKQLRSLAHDLSNSLETIMQASYLLAQADLKEADKKWLEMVKTPRVTPPASAARCARSCVPKANKAENSKGRVG